MYRGPETQKNHPMEILIGVVMIQGLVKIEKIREVEREREKIDGEAPLQSVCLLCSIKSTYATMHPVITLLLHSQHHKNTSKRVRMNHGMRGRTMDGGCPHIDRKHQRGSG